MADSSSQPQPMTSEQEREKSRQIGSLRALLPFMLPYRWLMAGALTALVLTATVSLTIPLAVRRVVDGFETDAVTLLDKYFLAALGLASLLAIGTGLRYYLVTRLG
ncbi:MAG: ABC transporter, partial [Alphaproteobacteria bacterium]|nr:ABC transporter [Alphaproteobacteria bacterium]